MYHVVSNSHQSSLESSNCSFLIVLIILVQLKLLISFLPSLRSVSLRGVVDSQLPAVKHLVVKSLVGFFSSINIAELYISESFRLNIKRITFPISLSVAIRTLTTSPACPKKAEILSWVVLKERPATKRVDEVI